MEEKRTKDVRELIEVNEIEATELDLREDLTSCPPVPAVIIP